MVQPTLRKGDTWAVIADKEIMKEYAQWESPELQLRVGATRSSVVEGVDAAISARVAEECNRILGQELSDGGGPTAF